MSTRNSDRGNGRGGRRSTSWKPGQSGNPKGRPSGGVGWRDLIAEFSARETPAEFRKFGSTWKEALVAAAFRNAVEGNAGLVRTILERSDIQTSSEATASEHEQLRRQVELELRLDAAESDRKLVEALRGDPARQKQLLELQARAWSSTRGSQICSGTKGVRGMSSNDRDLIAKAELCRNAYREGLRFPPWSAERANFWAFSFEKFVEWFLVPDLPIADFHRKWIRLLCSHQHLLLLAPRGHGKTTVVGCWYSLWRIFVNPNSTILLVASSADISAAELRSIRQHIEMNERLRIGFGPLGPPDAIRWTQDELIVDRPDRAMKDATVKALGQCGSIFGLRISDGFALCDDIVDDFNVATSEGRARLWEWFTGTLLPVLGPHEQIIVCGTRKHFDDLYARLMEVPQFHTEKCEAIIENSDGSRASLWPAVWPLDALDSRREMMGSILFDREYMNVVLADSNSLFPMSWFRGEGGRRGCYALDEQMLDHRPDGNWIIVQAVDVAIGQSESASYFVVVTLGRDERGDIHLLHLLREHLTFPDQLRAIEELYGRFQPTVVVVETNGYQAALQQALPHYIPVVPHMTTRQKHDPQEGIPILQPLIEGGRLRFPMADPASRLKSEIVISELNQFGRAKHDDCVMALWMGVSRLLKSQSFGTARAEIIRSSKWHDPDDNDGWRRRWPRDPGGVAV